jgi:hypothetical protein
MKDFCFLDVKRFAAGATLLRGQGARRETF